MKVEITLERTQRVCLEFDVTEEELEILKSGLNLFHDQLEKELKHGDTVYDYAVNDLDGNEIVPWS